MVVWGPGGNGSRGHRKAPCPGMTLTILAVWSELAHKRREASSPLGPSPWLPCTLSRCLPGALAQGGLCTHFSPTASLLCLSALPL